MLLSVVDMQRVRVRVCIYYNVYVFARACGFSVCVIYVSGYVGFLVSLIEAEEDAALGIGSTGRADKMARN